MRQIFLIFCALPAVAQAPLNGFADNGLDREVVAAAQFNLTRITDQNQLRDFIGAGILVKVPARGAGFVLDDRIGGHASANGNLYRSARPYTERFLTRLGAQFVARFHGRHFVVTSLARTCAYQERLRRSNHNAAPCEKTSHTTGATLDLRWSDLTGRERRWIEGVLTSLEAQGLIQATKEHFQMVYHVMVYPPYRSYHPMPPSLPQHKHQHTQGRLARVHRPR